VNETTPELLIEAMRIQHNQTCVVHVRIGDVLERLSRRGGHSIKWVMQNGAEYVHPVRYYKRISKQLFREGIKRVVLVAGAHQTYGTGTNSVQYLNAVTAQFKQQEIFHRYGQNPDEDFAFMTSAACFVQGKGGFSALAALVAQKRGANVY
jgi:hypothetical protein